MFSIVIYIVLVGILFYTALIYNSSAMVVLAFAATGFVMLSALFLIYRRLTLSFRIQIPIGVADKGKPVRVVVAGKNRSPLICSRIKLHMVCRNTLLGTVQKQWLKAADILPGTSTLEYSLMLPAPGNYEVQLDKIRVYDLTGLLFLQIGGRRKRGVSCANIQVLPEMFGIGIRLTEAVRNFYGESDVYDQEKAGHDNSEIFRIRPFAAGDKVQSIHWKLSARMDEMMVKENSLPKACAVILLLDHIKGRNQLRQEAFLTIAVSLSFSLMDAGCPHYVAWYEEKTKDITRVRVEDEESYYLFLNYYIQERGNGSGNDLLELYREKYRAEIYVHVLRFTEELTLCKNDEVVIRFSGEELEEELSGTEIVL